MRPDAAGTTTTRRTRSPDARNELASRVHVHPKAHAQPPPPATPTGIDYLHLIHDRHTRALGERLHYAQLTDPDQPTDSHQRADPDQPAEPTPDSDPGARAQTPPDPALDAELAAFAAMTHHGDTDDPAGLADTDEEHNR